LDTPRGLAFDGAGNLYQSDAGSGKIYKYTPSGARSTFASGLGWPMSLAFDGAGNLYEADWDSGKIYKFATNGAKSTFVSGLMGPWGLAFDSAGNLYETDFYGSAINKFTTNGAQSTFASGLSEPEGLAFDSAGNLYEADPGSGNIYEFTNGTQITFADGLNNPAALAVQPVPPTPPSLELHILSGYPFPGCPWLSLYGTLGDTYTVQYATNLAAPKWTTMVIVPNLSTNPDQILDCDGVGQPMRFYRAIQQ
jgi:sugar lactone lactonase YvrE